MHSRQKYNYNLTDTINMICSFQPNNSYLVTLSETSVISIQVSVSTAIDVVTKYQCYPHRTHPRSLLPETHQFQRLTARHAANVCRRNVPLIASNICCFCHFPACTWSTTQTSLSNFYTHWFLSVSLLFYLFILLLTLGRPTVDPEG